MYYNCHISKQLILSLSLSRSDYVRGETKHKEEKDCINLLCIVFFQ